MAIFRQIRNFGGGDPTDTLITARTATSFSGIGENIKIDFTGTGFAYDSLGELTGGTLTGYRVFNSGLLTYQISGLSVSVKAFLVGSLDITAGNDTYYGQSSFDSFEGNAGNDLIYGNGGTDFLDGGSGNDTVDGGAGTDTLDGGQGNDLLRGGTEADRLFGDTGTDKLNGGAGADSFIFDGIRVSLKGAARDIIQDFNRAEGDKIDLQDIDANASGAGNGTFIFQTVKGAAFTGVKGQLHYSWIDAPVAANDKTIIEGDVNGDKVADFQIELTGLKTLFASDFVL